MVGAGPCACKNPVGPQPRRCDDLVGVRLESDGSLRQLVVRLAPFSRETLVGEPALRSFELPRRSGFLIRDMGASTADGERAT